MRFMSRSVNRERGKCCGVPDRECRFGFEGGYHFEDILA